MGGGGGEGRGVAAGGGALAIAGCCLALGRIDGALLALVLGLAGVALLSPDRRGWTAGGFGYAAVAQVASVLVRLDPEMGFVALVFVLLIVWVTDIGGCFCCPRGGGGAASPPAPACER